MSKQTKTPEIKKEGIYEQIERLLFNGCADDHFEDLHDMYFGFMKYSIKEELELQPSKDRIDRISHTYEIMRGLIKEVVKAEEKFRFDETLLKALNRQQS